MRVGPRGRALLVGAAAVAGLAAALLLWRVDPAAPANPYPKCVLHAWIGLYCPGCGALRALHRLLHGELLAALRMNALVPLLTPLLLVGIVQQSLPWLWPSRAPERASVRSLWALVGVVVLFGIARNLPFAPFDRLAPQGGPSVRAPASAPARPAPRAP